MFVLICLSLEQHAGVPSDLAHENFWQLRWNWLIRRIELLNSHLGDTWPVRLIYAKPRLLDAIIGEGM